MAASYEPIKTKRTFEIIVDLIKEKIFSGEYQSGERLPAERDMAAMVQVSRSAVREAYHTLELLDIVEIRKGTGGGTFIREPSNRSITQSINNLIRLRRISLDDIMETRLVLEKNLADMAMGRITEEDFGKLQSHIDQGFELLRQGKTAHEANIAFHLTLAEVSGNALLVMVYTSVMDLFQLVLKGIGADHEMSHIIAEEHNDILRLMRQGDSNALLDFLDRHIRGSNERLLKISKKYPEFQLDKQK